MADLAFVLRNGVPTLIAAASGGGAGVPYKVADGSVVTIPDGYQAPAPLAPLVAGTLIVNGALVLQ